MPTMGEGRGEPAQQRDAESTPRVSSPPPSGFGAAQELGDLSPPWLAKERLGVCPASSQQLEAPSTPPLHPSQGSVRMALAPRDLRPVRVDPRAS